MKWGEACSGIYAEEGKEWDAGSAFRNVRGKDYEKERV